MLHSTRLVVAVFLLSLVMVDQRIWSMGGGAITLHQILAQADVVAVATVTASKRAPDGTQSDALLHVERVIHGTVADKSVLVVNDDPNACMGPPATYVVGKRVLVFLVHQENVRYSTCGYSHGVRVLDENALASSIQRIQEFYRIEGVQDDAQREQHWAEWAVRCAENSCTRRDALTLLCRGTHGKLGGKPLPNEPNRYFQILDETQQDRLLNTLKQAPGDQIGRQDASDLMRVIAFSVQDPSLLRIAESTTELAQSSDAKKPSRAFDAKFDSLLSDFVARCNVVLNRRIQKLSP